MTTTTTTHYTSTAPTDHRKAHGQFFTPKKVADFMLNWVLLSGIKSVYDPAFGLGAFAPSDQTIKFSASEVDPLILDFYEKNAQGSGTPIVFCEDYLTTWGRRHSNVVCNPPYMRFHNFLNRSTVMRDFKKHLGIQVSGYTNMASAFLLKSLSELDGRGRLSYIMPLEFLNAGYGEVVKRTLIADSHLFGIIRLTCERDIFPEVTTSLGIILYDSTTTHARVRFYSLTNTDSLAHIESLPPTNTVDVKDLDPSAKWNPHFEQNNVLLRPNCMLPLNYYGRFSRGIATGANEFFILSKAKVAHLGLSPEDYQPCITRSSQIRQPVLFEEDVLAMLDEGSSSLLFSTSSTPSVGARNYIAYGESVGYHRRFLTSHRNPWYKTETRSPAALLFGAFSRGGYKIILNKSRVLNLTCYHGFHPNASGSAYINHLFLYLFSRVGRRTVSLSMRKYGAALDKFEPNDLNYSLVPRPSFFDRMTEHTTDYGIRSLIDTSFLPEDIEQLFEELTTAVG